MREEVLDAAMHAVMHDRNAEYAPPEDNFRRIAAFWNTYLEGRSEITPTDVGVMCGLIKVARIMSSPEQLDHYVDLAGYAACAADCAPIPGRVPDPVHRTPPPEAAQVIERPARFEGEDGVLKVAYPEPGINTFYADGGRKVALYPEQVERAEAEGVLVFL